MIREPSFDETCALTAGAAMWASVAVPDADIPAFTMSDGPMGIASGNVDERDISLLSPCATALGASWDVEIARKVGSVVGSDAVARGIDAVLAPNINLARSPLSGRAFEYFSEDPLLAGVMGAGWINGLQSTGTGSVAKHLVCNDSETERDRVNVVIDERTLREVYLLPFEFAAEAGCAGMLAAYNKVNGQWCSEQAHVITQIVKGEWQFPYLIMSDWFGTHSTQGCLNGGLDLEMPGPFRFLGPKAAMAVSDGLVPPERVADAALRVAATARKVTGAKTPPLAPEQAEAILEEAAAAGMVLLKNKGDLLPLLPASIKRLAVIGPNAAAPCYQGATFARIAVAPEVSSPVEAIRSRFNADCEVVFEPGVDPQPRLPAMPVSPARDLGDGCADGMTVDYFASPDCSGTPLTSETRNTNSLVWFHGQHMQGHFNVPGSIRASGRFTPQLSGTHRLYLGATGSARILVDGRELLAAGGPLEAKDVMGTLKRGDADVAEVELDAGREVNITVEFCYTGARVQGLWYGIRSPDSPAAMLARAVEAARYADVVFLIVGETSDSSVESKDRPDTRLADEQIALIEAITAANPRTVIVSNVGHAFDTSWEDTAAALLIVWYPGQGFAPALAQVLAGDREPGGRMPVSIAAEEAHYCGANTQPDAEGNLSYAEGTRFGYRGLIAGGTPARHALGSGMGYARFAWDDVEVLGDGVAVTVRNITDRAGADVVQLYRDTPECALIGFAKVWLEPGEARRIVVTPEAKMLRLWRDGWQAITGDLPVRVARHAEDPGLGAILHL
ncbi:MAG: glycoside hydrolase family 3 C-terminal domain-containing protein [Novosphingobium sp.]